MEFVITVWQDSQLRPEEMTPVKHSDSEHGNKETDHLILSEVAHTHDAPGLRGFVSRTDPHGGQLPDLLSVQSARFGIS